VRRLLLLFVTLFVACATGPLPRSVAFVLDSSVAASSQELRDALHGRFSNADFIDVVLPADKHEAIVIIRKEKDSRGFAFEVYRNGEFVRSGRADSARTLPGEVEIALRRG
jgi:hypothetical protein